MYASSACESVFHVDPYDIEGKPILLFVRSDDLEMFVEQMDLVKAEDKIVQMKFWFQSPNWPCEIPCEAVFVGSSDAILAIMRVCKPFARKHLLTDRYRSADEDIRPSRSSRAAHSYYPSPRSPSTSPPRQRGLGPLRTPRVTRSKLDSIKIVELGDDEFERPVVVKENDPTLIDKDMASVVLAFKGVVINNDRDDND
ncbi:hypothetical protein BGZ79_000686 [Entomortierella chlamydospora]|nr:hypothetical protein BGZ79_000686 [Entomortierella chlamydospora]